VKLAMIMCNSILDLVAKDQVVFRGWKKSYRRKWI